MKVNYATIEYQVKHNKIYYSFYCEECGTISNTIDKSNDAVTLQSQLRNCVESHDKLHYMALKGELTNKFITMVKGV